MNRFIAWCALAPLSLLGCALYGGRTLQLIPSPSGAYQAVVLDCTKGKSAHASVLKVVRTGERLDCESNASRALELTSTTRPHLTWMTDKELVIDGLGERPRDPLPGEVSFVFSPWRAVLLPLRPLNPADVDASSVMSAAIQEATALTGPMTEMEVSLLNQSVPATDNRTPFGVSPAERKPVKLPPVEQVCGFPGLTWPTDFSVLAGGGQKGLPSTLQIDRSGTHATTMTVTVDNPQKPVVLMLGAYMPTIWTVRKTPGTTLLAVLASGYYRQIVTGLEPNVPVLIHTYENESPCGFFVIDTRRLETLNPFAQQFFGREIDMVHPAGKGTIHMGLAATRTSPWMSRGDAPLEAHIDPTAPPILKGKAAIDDAVSKGLLRPATQRDLLRWKTRIKQLIAQKLIPPKEGKRPIPLVNIPAQSFVILKPMAFPNLHVFGAEVFFVPKGMKRPRGETGHAMILDFNDMSCKGPACVDVMGHDKFMSPP